MKPSAGRPHRQNNQIRADVAVALLDRHWAGRNWLPPWPKPTSDDPLTLEELTMPDLSNLSSITQIAIHNGVALPSLYQPGGVIFQACQASIQPSR
jgi:hypothetical protein